MSKMLRNSPRIYLQDRASGANFSGSLKSESEAKYNDVPLTVKSGERLSLSLLRKDRSEGAALQRRRAAMADELPVSMNSTRLPVCAAAQAVSKAMVSEPSPW